MNLLPIESLYPLAFKEPPVFSRRRFLRGAAIATVLATSTATIPAYADAGVATVADFLTVSEKLTGRTQLDPVTAERMLQYFESDDHGFGNKLKQLGAALGELADMRDYAAWAARQAPDIDKTARSIVSAWYLGRVGEGKNARVVSFFDALQYSPARGITTVPTYAVGGYAYWAQPV